jgi:hypothetical protein
MMFSSRAVQVLFWGGTDPSGCISKRGWIELLLSRRLRINPSSIAVYPVNMWVCPGYVGSRLKEHSDGTKAKKRPMTGPAKVKLAVGGPIGD